MLERFSQMPSALRAQARWERLGDDVPCLLVHPDWESGARRPIVVWLHGRTVDKETDPGRYLRWMRSGLAVCAIDLPGHGERHDPTRQDPAATLVGVARVVDELDRILDGLEARGVFDLDRCGIGGMSAGGMATLARLCRPHPFAAASVEATTGSWGWQARRAMFNERLVVAMNPIDHLEEWREIPLQVIHSRGDEWVAVDGQLEFVAALRGRYDEPEMIETVLYEQTGAPFEHAGFGRYAADAKERQRAFFSRHLVEA